MVTPATGEVVLVPSQSPRKTVARRAPRPLQSTPSPARCRTNPIAGALNALFNFNGFLSCPRATKSTPIATSTAHAGTAETFMLGCKRRSHYR